MTNVDPGTAPDVRSIGFFSPPGWFDPSPAWFQGICAHPVQVQQCPLSLPGFDWRIDSIARTEPELLAAARELGETGCDLVANAAGVPVGMSEIAIVDAFAALGADRVGLACTYYSGDWKNRWARYVRASGLEVIVAQNLAEQGLMPIHDDADRAHWAPTAEQISESVRRIAEAAPQAAAIAISGVGSRTLALDRALESEVGRPVFGSNTALYWAVAKTAGVELTPGILGRLTMADIRGVAGCADWALTAGSRQDSSAETQPPHSFGKRR